MKISKKNTGMTIIELLIVVSIVAILSTIAFPSFNAMSDKSAQRSATVEFIVGMSYARAESVRTGSNVHLRTLSGDDLWTSGWCVTTASDCDGDVIRRFDMSSGMSIKSTTSSISAFSFNSEGFLESTSDSVSFCTNTDDNRITITPIGQALLTDCSCDNDSMCT